MSKVETFGNPGRSAEMTGKETEGEDAGKIVCPEIYLWNLANNGLRASSSGKIAHGEAVYVERLVYNMLEETLYKVRSKKNPRLRGWVTDRFVVLEDA